MGPDLESQFPPEWEKEAAFAKSAAEYVGRATAEHFLTTLRVALEHDCQKCESEHERLFLLAWATLCERTRCTGLFSLCGDQTQWRIHRPYPISFELDEAWAREMHDKDEQLFRQLQDKDFIEYDGARQDWLAPQYPVLGKAVDFLCIRFDYTILNPRDPDRRTTGNLRREREVLRQCRPVVVEIGSEPGSRQRDRELQAEGFSVARFSGPEVIANPLKCADDVDRLLSPGEHHDQWRRPKAAPPLRP